MYRRRKKKQATPKRSRTYASWCRRVELHQGRVGAARTPEEQLRACYDRFRSAVKHGAATQPGMAMARWLVEQASGMWATAGVVSDKDRRRRERMTGEIKDAEGVLPILNAAFRWYRAETEALRRLYGEDMQALIGDEMYEAAQRLNSEAVKLEDAARPSASSGWAA